MEIMMFNLMWISRIKNVSYIYDLLCLSTKSSVLKIILHRTCTLSKFNAVFTRGCIVFLESSINIQTLIIWYRHSLNVSSIIYTNWIIRTYFYQLKSFSKTSVRELWEIGFRQLILFPPISMHCQCMLIFPEILLVQFMFSIVWLCMEILVKKNTEKRNNNEKMFLIF